MRDVLGTIAADQDAIIRAGSRGALVVDGGPGTGKTVVALHRTAYLLYSDPRLGHRRGGVLFVGPHQPYLAYVSDVLPSLGEEGVQTCTLRDLVAEGAARSRRDRPEVARLKATVDLVRAIEPAVALYEEPPTEAIAVTTPWDEVWLSADDWAAPSTRRPPARRTTRPSTSSGRSCSRSSWRSTTTRRPRRSWSAGRWSSNRELRTTLDRAWPMLEATDLVGDLWSVPAYLRRCAPGLSVEEVRRLQRSDPTAWTVSDLPLLDAARQRLGDPEASRRRRRRDAAMAAERERDGTGRRPPHRDRRLRDARHVDAAGPRTSVLPWSTRRRLPAPTPTCSPDRSPTSSWTRPRS